MLDGLLPAAVHAYRDQLNTNVMVNCDFCDFDKNTTLHVFKNKYRALGAAHDRWSTWHDSWLRWQQSATCHVTAEQASPATLQRNFASSARKAEQLLAVLPSTRPQAASAQHSHTA
jgi:hypothetical protein